MIILLDVCLMENVEHAFFSSFQNITNLKNDSFRFYFCISCIETKKNERQTTGNSMNNNSN